MATQSVPMSTTPGARAFPPRSGGLTRCYCCRPRRRCTGKYRSRNVGYFQSDTMCDLTSLGIQRHLSIVCILIITSFRILLDELHEGHLSIRRPTSGAVWFRCRSGEFSAGGGFPRVNFDIPRRITEKHTFTLPGVLTSSVEHAGGKSDVLS